MRIAVIGGTGLIGSAIVSRLAQEGHDVIAVARRVSPAARAQPKVSWIALDFGRATSADLASFLPGADVVVNAAGTLQDGPGESVAAVHVSGVAALVEACRTAGASRVVHLSAIGVDVAAPSAFSRSKREAEEVLAASGLAYVVLRPSVVVGRQAYGGSALFRGLASLPVLPLMPGTGELQVVQLDDVVETVAFFVRLNAPSGLSLDLAGPERLAFAEVVGTYRRWLGYAPARTVHLPTSVAHLLYRMGDFAGLLGWRPPLRGTAALEIVRGAVGDAEPWTRLTGVRPQALADALAAEPAGVQERWFASLYMLKPVIFTVFALFWISTGLLSIGPGYAIGVALMEEGGAGSLSGFSVIAGGLADLAIGLGIAFRRTARTALWVALGISLFYAVAGTLLLPRLWIDSLGPMVKIWPIVVFNLVALAILRDR